MKVSVCLLNIVLDSYSQRRKKEKREGAIDRGRNLTSPTGPAAAINPLFLWGAIRR